MCYSTAHHSILQLDISCSLTEYAEWQVWELKILRCSSSVMICDWLFGLSQKSRSQSEMFSFSLSFMWELILWQKELWEEKLILGAWYPHQFVVAQFFQMLIRHHRQLQKTLIWYEAYTCFWTSCFSCTCVASTSHISSSFNLILLQIHPQLIWEHWQNGLCQSSSCILFQHDIAVEW